MGHVNTFESFEYLWIAWRVVGLHPPKRLTWLYNIYSFVSNFMANGVLPILIFINIFFVGDIALIMQNLQASPTIIVASLKQIVIFLKMSSIKKIKHFTDKLDQRANLHQDEVDYLRTIVKQCKSIAYSVQISLVLSLSSYAIPSLIHRQLVFDGWFPFDWTASNMNYYSAYIYQLWGTLFQVVQAAADDGFSLLSINVLRGHIHALGMRVAKIGRDPSRTLQENYTELKACIGDHKDIIRYFETIKPIISRCVLMQFIITAFVLCISVVYYLIFNRGFAQLISTLTYMTAILGISFPVCYFANLLMTETEELTTAIYDCNWMDQSPEFRRCIIIFMQRSHQQNIIKAGLVQISIETYISIIRFSFSVFTLLSELNQ